MSYQTSSKRSPQFWLLIGDRELVFFWHQSEARAAAIVWNWSGKTLSPGALLAVLYFSLFHVYFSARLDFPSPPLSAPGSPRMHYYARPMRFGSRGPRKLLRPRQTRRSDTFCLTWGGAFGSGRAGNNFSELMKDVQQPWRVQGINRAFLFYARFHC